MEALLNRRTTGPIAKWLVIGLGAVLLAVWTMNTPQGLLGKADAIAYAVCHRIASHSYFLGERQVPLCARCSGMYLGALLGIAYQVLRGRFGAMPPRRVFAFFGVLFVFFGADGVNSYLHFFPQAPSLYQPVNWLRLITGTGMGLAISAVIVPAFHQTIWNTWEPRSGLGTWKEVAVLVALAAGMDLLFLTLNPLVLYPLALLSALGVVVLLSMVYSMVWVMVFRSDNRFHRLSEIWFPLAGGLTTAMLQVALLDLGRFWLTGTWAGFHL